VNNIIKILNNQIKNKERPEKYKRETTNGSNPKKRVKKEKLKIEN
jgi:hypothetical protein